MVLTQRELNRLVNRLSEFGPLHYFFLLKGLTVSHRFHTVRKKNSALNSRELKYGFSLR